MGLFLLATVLGHVANIVTNVSASRKEFQGKQTRGQTCLSSPVVSGALVARQ